MIKLVYDPDIETYRESLSMMSPDIYGENQAEAVRSSQRFAGILAQGGQLQVLENGRRFWVHYDNSRTIHEANGDYKQVAQYSDAFLWLEQFHRDPHRPGDRSIRNQSAPSDGISDLHGALFPRVAWIERLGATHA